MRLSIESHALEIFIAVADCGSFTLAADRAHITQSAISKRIAQLERQLGNALFNRLGKTLSLTEAGNVLYQHARIILSQIEDAERAIGNLASSVSGPLDLGTSHHIGLHRLPPFIRRFTQTYRSVELNLQFYSSEETCRKVENGELEIGIVTLPPEPIPQLVTETLWNDPLIFVASPDLVQTKLKARELLDLPAILPESGTFTREIIDRALRTKNVSVAPTLSTNYLETNKMLVSVGLGWSVLPESMISEDIKVLDVEGIRLQRSLGLIYHKKRTLSNAATALRTTLGSAA